MSTASASLKQAYLEPARSGEQPLPSSSTADFAPRSDVHVALALVETREAFDALEQDWNELFSRAGRDIHLFQTFNWLWHWTNHFLPAPGMAGPRLAIVTGRIDGRLVLAWPLVAEKVGPITRLTWMGEPVSQYGDLLIDADVANADEVLRSAWTFVARKTRASVLQLRKVRQDSNVAPLLAEKDATVVAELKAPYLDLASAPSFAEYETRYSSGARRNRKRQRRRLGDRGEMVLAWYTSGADAVARTAEAFTLKHIWLKERGLVSPALADPRTARFFADVAGADARPAGCHVLALTCGGRTVALEIGVRCKGRSAIHIITYDLEFEKTAAGSLLMEDSIRRACDDGMAVFDLLAPGDGYKLEWADEAVVVRDWAASLSIAGYLYSLLYLGLFRNAAKRALDLLPVDIRRKVTDTVLKVASRGVPRDGA